MLGGGEEIVNMLLQLLRQTKGTPKKVSFASPEEISPLPVKSAATEHQVGITR